MGSANLLLTYGQVCVQSILFPNLVKRKFCIEITGLSYSLWRDTTDVRLYDVDIRFGAEQLSDLLQELYELSLVPRPIERSNLRSRSFHPSRSNE